MNATGKIAIGCWCVFVAFWMLMIFGTAILVGNVGGLMVLVMCFCGFWVKLRQEEILLSKHLTGYSDYMRRTKALVPFVL